MTDKLQFSTDTRKLRHEIFNMRNDKRLQNMLSLNYNQETLADSILWAERQVSQRALEFIIFDGEFAGFSKLFPASHDGAGRVYSVGIAVLEGFRGLGIAKRTLTKRFGALAESDCVVTSIRKDNIPSLNLFGSLGFTVLPVSTFRGIKVCSPDWTLVKLDI